MDRIRYWTFEGEWFYWIYWTLPISLVWFTIGISYFGRQIFVERSTLNIMFVAGSIILAFFPFLLGISMMFIIVTLILILNIYDPKNLWVGLPVTFCLWLYCWWRSKNSKLAAATLVPWLAAMTVAEALYLAASTWLPRAKWHWLPWKQLQVRLFGITTEPLPQ
jgi:hypothetical protein